MRKRHCLGNIALGLVILCGMTGNGVEGVYPIPEGFDLGVIIPVGARLDATLVGNPDGSRSIRVGSGNQVVLTAEGPGEFPVPDEYSAGVMYGSRKEGEPIPVFRTVGENLTLEVGEGQEVELTGR